MVGMHSTGQTRIPLGMRNSTTATAQGGFDCHPAAARVTARAAARNSADSFGHASITSRRSASSCVRSCVSAASALTEAAAATHACSSRSTGSNPVPTTNLRRAYGWQAGIPPNGVALNE